MISLAKKLKMVMLELEISQVELANKTTQSQQNLSRKLVADNFNIREYERLVKALGCELEISIILPDGRKL